jgi:hypothetical protein
VQLQGASLNIPYLQSASLDKAQLQGAARTNVCDWRADARTAGWKDTQVAATADCGFEADNFEKLKKMIAEQVPEGDFQRAAAKRIEQRLDKTKAMEGEDEIENVWAAQASSSPAPKVFEKSLAEQWRKTGCDANGAPYVLRALLDRLSLFFVFVPSSGDILDYSDAPVIADFPAGRFPSFAANSPEVPKLAAAFLDKDCAGASGISEAEIAELKAIRDRARPPAPKP